MFNYWAENGKEPHDEAESQSWAKVIHSGGDSPIQYPDSFIRH